MTAGEGGLSLAGGGGSIEPSSRTPPQKGSIDGTPKTPGDYITPAVWGVPQQGDKIRSGPQVGRWLYNPCRLGGGGGQGDKIRNA